MDGLVATLEGEHISIRAGTGELDDVPGNEARRQEIVELCSQDMLTRKSPGKLRSGSMAVPLRTNDKTFGEAILIHSSSLALARSVALTHHERWSGGGYPEGLKGEEIPLESRIVAVVDVFDALTSVRPYKEPWDPERAVELLRNQSGVHFEPRVVDALLRLYQAGALDDLIASAQSENAVRF